MVMQRSRDPTEAIRNKRHIDDMRRLLDMAEGRRVIWDILEWTRYLSASMEETDRKTAFREGQRDIGMKIFASVMAADERGFEVLRAERRKTVAEERAVIEKLKEAGFDE